MLLKHVLVGRHKSFSSDPVDLSLLCIGRESAKEQPERTVPMLKIKARPRQCGASFNTDGTLIGQIKTSPHVDTRNKDGFAKGLEAVLVLAVL